MSNKLVVLVLAFLPLAGCKTLSNITGIGKKTCLVLSVGGAKGLAHIGAVDAIKHSGIKIDCVYGNSMGAVIGGLYAWAPKDNLKLQYQEVLAGYLDEKKKPDAISNIIVGGLSLILSGGTSGWETFLNGVSTAIYNKMIMGNFSSNRFESVLNTYFKNGILEDTKIPFATSWQEREGDGMEMKIGTSGNLARSISRSANNPFVFGDTTLDYLDPGTDRIARVPAMEACNTFNPTRIIVINVTGKEIHWSGKLRCPIKTVIVDINPDNLAKIQAIRGSGKHFDKIYEAGYREVMEQL